MKNYLHLDALILERLKRGNARFYELEHNNVINAECERLELLSGRDGFRILDGRLTALRKAGLIIPGRKIGWGLK